MNCIHVFGNSLPAKGITPLTASAQVLCSTKMNKYARTIKLATLSKDSDMDWLKSEPDVFTRCQHIFMITVAQKKATTNKVNISPCCWFKAIDSYHRVHMHQWVSSEGHMHTQAAYPANCFSFANSGLSSLQDT